MAKERKALGTGLSVLFGDEGTSEDKSVSVLPIEKIEPRAEQPRNKFDEEALETLADSIRQHGIIQPITVRLLNSGMYQIIAGERRWRAARIAGISEIPVNIIEADDRTTAELALVENLQREDLNPIEEALGYKSLIEDYGLTQEEAAKSVGKSRSAITNSMRLLNLCYAVTEAVKLGSLSAGHARAIVALDGPEKQIAAADKVIKEGLSVRSTERLVNQMMKQQGENPEVEKEQPFVDYIKELSDELTKTLGRKVRISDGKRTGKIELEFCGSDDREALVEKLRKLA